MYIYRKRKSSSIEHLARNAVVFSLIAVAYASILAGIVTIFAVDRNSVSLSGVSSAGIEQPMDARPEEIDEERRIALLQKDQL